MNISKSRSIDMLDGPLFSNILAFSIPIMLTSLLQMLFNQADQIVVGQFAGTDALAAVGATGSLCFMMIALFGGIGRGANVVIAQLMGARDKDGVSRAVHTSVLVSVIAGLLMTVIGIAMSRPLLTLMSTPDEIIDQSTLYMKLYFGGIMFIMVYNVGSAVLRSKGDTRRPLYYLLVAGVLNVVLNLIFVIVFKWGVAGVAIATVISNAVSTVLVITALFKETDETKLVMSKMKVDGGILLNVLRIGVPAGIQGMMFAVSNVVIQSSINSFGSASIVAANTAAANIENFVYIGMNFSEATLTFISQNVGAKRYRSIGRITRLTMALDVGGAALIGVLVWVFGKYILALYTTDPGVIEIGMTRMTWVALFLFLNAVLDIFVSALRGMGLSIMPTIAMIVGICGIRIVWLLTVFAKVGTLASIYMCFPVSWAITSAVTGVMWYREYRKMIKDLKE